MYCRPVTVLFAIIQILASVAGLFLSGSLQLVCALFGGVDNLSASLLLVLVKLIFYIITGITLLAQVRFALLLAFASAFIGLASDVAALVRGETGGLFGVIVAFHIMYLVWFGVVQRRGCVGQQQRSSP